MSFNETILSLLKDSVFSREARGYIDITTEESGLLINSNFLFPQSMVLPFFNFIFAISPEFSELIDSGDTVKLSVVVQLLKVAEYEMIRRYIRIVF